MKASPSPLIVVCGPTGSGKSALAIYLARAMGGEIVNFDSVQVYRGLDIGSAKTPLTDRCGVPHHLLDIMDPREELTAGEYARRARTTLSSLAERQSIPVLAGGTGFYLRSLLAGLSPAPVRNPCIRSRLTDLGSRRPAALHRFLRTLDPDAAARIHPNDHQKLIRAVELASSGAGKAPREPLTGFRVLLIGLNPERSRLYQLLNARSTAMFESGGLVEETQALLAAGVPPEAKALQTLGYRQAVMVLQHQMTPAAALVELQTKTRQYAKRQMTWFRSEPGVHWLGGFGADAGIQQAALNHIEAELADDYRMKLR